MKFLKLFGWILLFVLVGIQLIRPDLDSKKIPQQVSIQKLFKVPDSVQVILKKSCYDCHSNQTKYPWYVHVQPIGWFLVHHVHEGKAELNFSEFGTYTPRKQKSKWFAIQNSIYDGTMPLKSYQLIHRKAILSPKEKKTLLNWVNKVSNEN